MKKIKTIENRSRPFPGYDKLPSHGIWVAAHSGHSILLGQDYSLWRSARLEDTGVDPAHFPSMEELKQKSKNFKTSLVGLIHFKRGCWYHEDESLAKNGWADPIGYCYFVDDAFEFDVPIVMRGFQGVWGIHDTEIQQKIQVMLDQHLQSKTTD